jgi:hypothetical protein
MRANAVKKHAGSGILAPRKSTRVAEGSTRCGAEESKRKSSNGSVAERFKAPVLKTGDRETYP